MTELPDTPDVLAPVDEARVRFALQAERLAEEALALLPVDPAAPRGDRLRRALDLKRRLDDLIEHAVVAEREEGTTWTQLAAVDGISKQAAHERWHGSIRAWAANGRTVFPSDSGCSTLEAARRLDALYAAQHPDHPQDAVSSGLDAVRFPGAVAAEAARRDRAAGLHTRLASCAAELRGAREESRLLTEGGARPDARAAVLARQAALREESAALYEELTAAEPQLADEHHTSAERARGAAASAREYADLLTARAEEAALPSAAGEQA